MSHPINVTITNGQPLTVSINGASGPGVNIANGGGVNVAVGQVAPGDATVLAGTVTIGTVTTLPAGSNATVVNNGTGSMANLSFGIPAGPYSNITVGETSTLPAGSNAAVTATSTNGTVTLNFAIPAGQAGANGAGASSWSSLTGVPSNFPTNLSLVSGLPANFPTNVSLVSGLAAGYAASNHSHNYVTALNNLAGSLTLAAGANVTLSANSSTSTLTIAASGGGLGANDAIDGGNYVGQIVAPTITITQQPTNTTAVLGLELTNLARVTANANIGGPIIFSGGSFFVTSQAAGSPSQLTLRQSTNGTSWTALGQLPAAMQRRPKGIVKNGNVVLLESLLTSSQNGGESLQVFRSADSGATFSGFPVIVSSGVDVYGTAATSLYAGSRYIVMTGELGYGPGGNLSQVLYTSSNSEAWTARYAQVNTSVALYTAAAYGNGKYVLVGPGSVATSTDAVAWTKTDVSQLLYSVVFGNGKFVATRYVSGQIGGAAVSTDGTNWSNVSLPAGVTYTGALSFTGGLFVAFGQGVDAATSQDGTNWAYAEMPATATNQWGSIAYGNNVAVITQHVPQIGFTVAHDGNVITGEITQSSTGSAAFNVSATVSSGTLNYQWQSSSDSGGNWASVSNATSSTLSLSGLNAANNGTLYRVALSASGASNVTSNSALLTVQ